MKKKDLITMIENKKIAILKLLCDVLMKCKMRFHTSKISEKLFDPLIKIILPFTISIYFHYFICIKVDFHLISSIRIKNLYKGLLFHNKNPSTGFGTESNSLQFLLNSLLHSLPSPHHVY